MEKGYDPFTIAQVLLSDKLGKSTKTRHEKIDGIDNNKAKKSNKQAKSKNTSPKYNDENMATLFINRGKLDNFSANKLVKALDRLSHIPSDQIGQIRIQKSYSFVDIDKSLIDKAIKGLNNKKILGKKIKVEEAKK